MIEPSSPADLGRAARVVHRYDQARAAIETYLREHLACSPSEWWRVLRAVVELRNRPAVPAGEIHRWMRRLDDWDPPHAWALLCLTGVAVEAVGTIRTKAAEAILADGVHLAGAALWVITEPGRDNDVAADLARMLVLSMDGPDAYALLASLASILDMLAFDNDRLAELAERAASLPPNEGPECAHRPI